MKKSVLIIGIGKFGAHLAEKMQDLGHDVLIFDRNEAAIEGLSTRFADAQVGDFTNEDVLRELDVASYDVVCVTLGDDFEASMVTTMLLKRLGAKYVVVRARSEIECDLLRKVGADEIVYADGDATDRLAMRMGGNNILDYIQLTGGYAIFEVPILKSWAGKSIAELEVRSRYKVNIVAIKNEEMLDPTPSPDYRFRADDKILVIGKSRDVFRLDAKNG